MGTAFSVLVRLELSAPGSQYLAGDHQLYNVIATTHGIVMIYFMVVPLFFYDKRASIWGGVVHTAVVAVVLSYNSGYLTFATLNAVYSSVVHTVYFALVLSYFMLLFARLVRAVQVSFRWGVDLHVLRFTFAVFYVLLLVVVYVLARPYALCDEDVILNFMLQGSEGPRFDNQLGPYLAGLIESDGSIYVPVSHKGSDGFLNYPAVKIYFHQDDLPLAEHLQVKLGHGTVSGVSGEKTVVLSLNTEAGIKEVVDMTNGYYRTPKHEAFVKLVAWYHNLDSSYSVVAKPVDGSPLYGNAWLAGFADGDASFEIRVTDSSRRVEVTFDLVQSRVNSALINKYLPVLESIAAFLLAKVTTSVVTNLSGTLSTRIRIRNTSRVGAGIIAQYFTLYPLGSSKWLNFVGWRSVYAKLLLGETKSQAGYDSAKTIKAGHNSRRTVFDWNHLSSFYER